MNITVVTGRWAKKFMEQESMEMVVPEHSTVGSVLGTLPIPADETGMTQVDGKTVKEDFLLSAGCILKIFPVIIGG